MPTTQPDGMHEEFKKVLAGTLRFNFLDLGFMNTVMAIDRFRNGAPANPQVVRRRETIRQPDGRRFKVIIMSPAERRAAIPALIYYHGGAFAVRYGSMHLDFCERYAHEAGCHAILVDYRLARRNPFPDGFDDCYQALEWTLERADVLGIDRSRIVVAGDSAGGALAAGVSQRALDEGHSLLAQMLVYPVLDSDCKTESARSFESTPVWNAASNRNMWDMYLRRFDRQDPPAYAVPGHREDLSRLPPAYIETAEFDPLRDEGLEYARRLKDAGVDVEVNPTSGTIHGFEVIRDHEQTLRSLDARIRFLQQQFGTLARS